MSWEPWKGAVLAKPQKEEEFDRDDPSLLINVLADKEGKKDNTLRDWALGQILKPSDRPDQ